MILTLCFLFKAPTLWELGPTVREECSGGLGRYVIEPLPLAYDMAYRHYYTGVADSFVRVFIPFVLLITLNVTIIVQVMQ